MEFTRDDTQRAHDLRQPFHHEPDFAALTETAAGFDVPDDASGREAR